MMPPFIKTLLLLAFFFSAQFAVAQRPLTNSRQSSYYTYLYKLSNADMLGFYKQPEKPFDDKVLRNSVDSFRTDKYWENTLPPGNYVKVYASENTLKYEVIENHSAFLKLFTSKYEHRFSLADKQGNYLTNAKVLLNGKTIAYDAAGNSWYFGNLKKARTLQVDYAGVSNFFTISPAENYRYGNNDDTFGEKLIRWWANLKKKFIKNRYRRYNPTAYTGFMAFNKPIYKPGDTVKFKAFIVNRKSKKPITGKKLLVKLVTGYHENKTLGMVSSYRDGGYEYSFVLNDSLKLSLDASYNILLTDPSVKSKSDREYDEEAERKQLRYSGSFKYEEYELKSITFNMRADKKEHWPGVSQTLYLKATDENDLPVADGRVILNVTAGNIAEYKSNYQYVPDTLWTHKFPLDAVGETKIVIPDSIFPKADMGYRVEAMFLNSNNEVQSADLNASFKYERFNILTDVVNDSLKISYQEFGKTANATSTVSARNAVGDTLSSQKITLPGFILINPNATEYNIETDSTETDIELKDFEGNLSVSTERTPDSVFFNVANPRKLNFFYSVFYNGTLVDGGQAKSLSYKKQFLTNKPITITLNYIWAGEIKTETATIVYRKDLLNIAVNQPVSVYPGQKINTDIVITDGAGKPVPNTDVTAWAITKKFSYGAPKLPYMGKNYRTRPEKKQLQIKESDYSGGIKLKWEKWGKEIGLDSIAYYQFTHPKGIYRMEEPDVDTITQVAPFVVQQGFITPVHILYIDNLPVYFSQAQQLQPYSFKVSPGYHHITLRTSTHYIHLDSVLVPGSKKLILSVDADNHPLAKMPDSLGVWEANNVNKYLVSVINNFDGRRAMVTQSDRVFFLNPYSVASGTVLTGPLSPNYSVYEHQGDKPQPFIAESNYSYLFEPGLLKQKSIATRFPFSRQLSLIPGTTNYKQYVLTNNAADSLWQDYLDNRSNSSNLFNNAPVTPNNAGKLIIKRFIEKPEMRVLIKNVILYRYDNPDFIRIYPGSTTDFGGLRKGMYRMLFLLKQDDYDIKENIEIKGNGINFYAFSVLPKHAKDSVSIKINRIISNRKSQLYQNYDDIIENDALRLKEAFNDKYFNTNKFTQVVSGKITGNDDKLPVVGATIKLKGTSIATNSDINGLFRLGVPRQGKLVVSYLGYFTQEIDFVAGTDVKVVLKAAQNQLNEVVVVGYGTSRRKDLTGAVTMVTSGQLLQGRAAGVTIVAEGSPGAGPTIFIRGASSIVGSKPLYVVDGVPVEDLKGLDINAIGEINVLKDAAATGIYGSRGANGVILISTKPKTNTQQASTDALPGGTQTLRKNFSDYAYWQPKLTTDINGKASFTSVFPDDITNWRTFVIGINGNRQSGSSEKQIKSFKSLSANFIAPQFAVEGDEMSLIGKVMNYNSTPAKLNRTFTYNGKILTQGDLEVSNSKIDTLPIVASATDSLAFEYSIKRDNGYFDGEQRKIPVVKQGVQETKGIFEALDRDTTINLKFDPAMGPVTFKAEASALPALAEEAKRLREYKYLCNEQLASKLKGLLSEKRIKAFLNEPFKYQRNILDVIKKLQQNGKANGTWGWWANTDEELWISLHAVEALAEAEKMGYTIQLNKQMLTNYLVYQLESYRGNDKLTCLQLLRLLAAKVDYPKYFAIIEKEYKGLKNVNNYNRLKLLLLKQQSGISIKTDSLLSTAHKTLFGNMYWGEESYRFFDNSIQESVIAYRIIKAEGKHPEVLAKIRGYFLEQRKLGEWRNTYESAMILETILPDLLQKGTTLKPSVLTLKGSNTETITTFPYTATLKDNAISISKTGSLPVYITGYQQFWNSKPQKVNKEFTVDTWFERKDDKVTRLKGGEAVQLKAEITVKGDADFVMVEIPIPAGCSYESKEQQWGNNEVHREFFKDKVSIFCRKLKEGNYTFTINLMPRYSGNYTLNPAKAEQMYFPVFYGREGIKKVRVE